MATGDKRANIYNKRNMPQEAWDQHFFRFLTNKIDDLTQAAFLQSGVIGDDTIGITGPAADVFALDTSLESKVSDGYGHIMDLAKYLLVTGLSDIRSYFENEFGVEYYVGIRYQEKPDDVERNPRSSEPEYPWYQDMIGELGPPDTVTDNTTYIRLEVNGLLESGVDHSRRPVTVWLNNPVSPVAALAYYTGEVEYSGGTNYIDIPYSPSTGPLGQTAPSFPISTTALDYAVFVPGVSWFRNTDITDDPNYTFIGTVTGAGAGNPPTVFDITSQRPVFLISLDRAYRASSADDPAPGRTIVANRKAVRIKQGASGTGLNDWLNEALRIDQLDQKGSFASNGATVESGYSGSTGTWGGWSHYMLLSDGSGNYLQKSEAFDGVTGTATCTFTRVGVDLTLFDQYIDNTLWPAIVKISGTDSSDGYYLIDSVLSASQLTITDASGVAIVFPSGVTGNIQVLAPLRTGGAYDWTRNIQSDDPAHNFAFPNFQTGIRLSCYANPDNPDKLRFLRVGNYANDEPNEFMEVFSGRLLMRGGGADYVNTPYRRGIVSGHAQVTVDKVDTTNIDTTRQPAEESQEWGYDYRGNAFGHDVAENQAGTQIGYAMRLPLWSWNGFDYDYPHETTFTRAGATTLQMDYAAFDTTDMPFDVGVFPNSIMCEVDFNSPNKDLSGIYFTYQKLAINQIVIQRADGSSPNIPVGATGTIRFYGGVFTGPIDTSNQPGRSYSFLMNLTAPNRYIGGIRFISNNSEATGVSSTDYVFGLYMSNIDNATFAVRDGGIVFARALTTKSLFGSHGLTQWDQVDTSLFTGDLAKIDEIDLSDLGLSRILTIPNAIPPTLPGDYIKIKGGGAFGPYPRAQSVFSGAGTALNVSGVGRWYAVQAPPARGMIANLQVGEREYWAFPIDMPHGCTLNSVEVRGTPGIGDGTANAMNITVWRYGHSTYTAVQLSAAGAIWSGGNGVEANVTLTCTQNNVIDNQNYDYYVYVESSYSATVTLTDRIIHCTTNQTVSGLGNHMLVGR